MIQAWGEVGVWLCSVFKVLNQCGEYFHYFETKLAIPIKPLHQSQLGGCSHFKLLDVGHLQIYGHMSFLYNFHTQSTSSSSSNRESCDACITKSSQRVVHACMCVCMFSRLVMSDSFCNPMDCSPQAPLSLEFSRQECWSRLPFPSPGDLPNPGVEPTAPAASSAMQAYSLLLNHWVNNSKLESVGD